MFTERAMFCSEFASEQSQMTRYLSILKTDIRQFVSTQRCDTLLELQEAANRWELEIKLQLREQRSAPVLSQPAPKRPKTADARTGVNRAALVGSVARVILGYVGLVVGATNVARRDIT